MILPNITGLPWVPPCLRGLAPKARNFSKVLGKLILITRFVRRVLKQGGINIRNSVDPAKLQISGVPLVPPLFENRVKQGGNLRISVKISRKYPKIFAPAARFIQDFDDFWQLRAAGEKIFDVFSSKTPRKRHFYKVFYKKWRQIRQNFAARPGSEKMLESPLVWKSGQTRGAKGTPLMVGH